MFSYILFSSDELDDPPSSDRFLLGLTIDLRKISLTWKYFEKQTTNTPTIMIATIRLIKLKAQNSTNPAVCSISADM